MSDSINKIQCFIIMPFSKTSPKHTKDYWTKHFQFLKSKIEEIPNVEGRRSDPLRGDILREIIRDLVHCEIVVADLTDLNPNVYWELGVRQSFKHGTITIAETRKKIAFDMGVKSILRYYPKDSMKNEEFVTQLKKAIIDCIENPDSPDSHVLETISGRGSLYEIIRHDETIRRIKALISEFKWNQRVFKEIYEYIKESTFQTDRLRSLAVELLIINRYLDLSDNHYAVLEEYCNTLHGVNGQLSILEHKPSTTESWFIDYEDEIKKMFRKTNKTIKWILKNYRIFNK